MAGVQIQAREASRVFPIYETLYGPFFSTLPGAARRRRIAISSSTKNSAGTTGSPARALNSPFGGKLVDLIVGQERAAEMKATAKDFASITLEERPLCDLELLAVGGFSPLSTFMNEGGL